MKWFLIRIEFRELGSGWPRMWAISMSMLDTLGSAMDLMRDVGPIANEVIIDATKKLHEFEQKGYFEFHEGIWPYH